MTDAAKPAYVILVRDRMIDADEFATYGQKARAAREGHAVTPLAFYGRHEVLEGAPVEGAVILTLRTMPDLGSFSQPTTSLLRAFGTMLTRSFITEESANLQPMPVWSFAPP